MDLNLAIAVHSEWKTLLLAAIINNETLDTASIAKDNCCELGKWLHSDAKARYGSLPSFVTCVAKHAKFHVEASKVAAAINTKKYPDAHAMLNAGTAYSAASSAVQVAIENLKTEAGL
jgi:methyl-accepting chemotaxis protein